MSQHKYTTQYAVKHESLTGDEIPDGWGACNDIIIHSILLPEDGSYSHLLVSRKGGGEEQLSGAELFKAWLMMAKSIAEHPDTPTNMRLLAKVTWDTFLEGLGRES